MNRCINCIHRNDTWCDKVGLPCLEDSSNCKMFEADNDNREIEIQMVMNLIQAMCEKNNMAIVIYKHEKLGPILAVQDAENGKHYALQINKEV